MNRSRLPAYRILFDTTKSILAYDPVRNNVPHDSVVPISQTDFSRRRQGLLNYYEKNICTDTTISLEMVNVLDELEKQEGQWGIVGNKAEFLTINSRASLCH